ncbi:MAG: ELWxxDGT repeat protein [Pirellulales bacterium]
MARRFNLEPLENRRLLAVTATLLADLNALGGSDPDRFVEVGSIAFFTANDGTNGQELWKSDGTEAGTVLVKDIFPGASGSLPFNLTNVNGTLFFSANDGITGIELWKSDGTLAGTVRVEDINPGAPSSSPFSFTNVSGTLFFQANDGITGFELWKSTGGAAADATTTSRVEDIFPGATGSLPQRLTNVGGVLFFMANDGTTGNELWKSTGGAAADATTTSRVEDINPGATDSAPASLTNVSGTLFFSANDGTTGNELWKSTGGAAADATTTSRVEDINPGAASSSAFYLTNVSGTLFFSANDGTNGKELWKSTGGAAADATTTSIVENINPGAADSSPNNLTNVSGTLFFAANDGTHGRELWKSKGTAFNTEIVADINPNAAASFPSNLTNVSGTLYFRADDGTHGFELWKSNGTLNGTNLVRDINLGSADSLPSSLANVNGTLYFSANDATGAEPWIVSPEIPVDPPAAVQSVVITDGSAQRSVVNRITVIFSEIVTIDPGAFELIKRGGRSVTVNVYTSVVDDHSVAVLSFSGQGIVGGSLADGNYALTIRADKIRDGAGQALDGDGNSVAGGNRVDEFFRFYGDADGDRDVDNLDYALFRSSYNKRSGDPTFLWFFDFDGNSRINFIDGFEFFKRKGRFLNP